METTNSLLLQVLAIFFLMHVASGGSRRVTPPSSCIVTNDTANCAEIHVTTIPKLQANIKVLLLDGNSLHVLKANSFSLTPGLTSLSLGNSQINMLDVDAFKGLSNLSSLNLSHNGLKAFSDSLFGSDLKNLRVLHLEYNILARITQNAFDHLVKLQELHLEHNKLTSIHPHAFTKLTVIKSITIDHNSLVTAYFGWFYPVNQTLTRISLGHNPWTCDSRMCGFKNWTQLARKKFGAMIDIVCNHSNLTLKNLHTKDVCKTRTPTTTTGKARVVGVAETVTIKCPNAKSTSWKFMSKSKNGSTFQTIKQDEKIWIKPGELTVLGAAKRDAGTYCCFDSVGEDVSPVPAGTLHTNQHCFGLKVSSIAHAVPTPNKGGSGTAAVVIIIIVTVVVTAIGVWYFRRKRRNYGLLNDESVFQPSYDDPNEVTRIPNYNGDQAGMGEAYV